MTRATDDPFALIADLQQRGEDFCVVTVVRTQDATSAKAGAKAVVLKDGTIRGFLGGGCVQAAIRKSAAAAMAEGHPRLIRVKPKDQVTASVDVDGTELHRSACPSGGTVELFVEPLRRAPRLIVCGASLVAIALADIGRRLGYRIAVAALAEDQGLFGEADERITGFDLSPLDIAADDWIAVATQGKRDREALTAALMSAAHYVAFVGSRRKAQVLSSQIREQGALGEDKIARLKAPAGLDIHAIEPAEIALSIMAEVIARRRAEIRAPNTEAAGARARA